MVSTRQSSNVGGGGECSGTVSDPGLGKTLRHGNVPPPPAPEPSCSGTVAVIESTPAVNLLDLPPEIVMKIMGYLNFRNITQLRPICRRIDAYCCSILNSSFQRLQTQMLLRFQSIKAKMPRRESARRNHPLACESDIVETLHMRLTLLQMTFGKHIERKHCCFFAGEILDEVYRILHYIKVTQKLIRPYKVTDELFDLSTMAMEYFKEHVEPTLPEIAYFGTDFLDFTGTFVPPSNNKQPAYLCLESPPHSVSKGDESPSHQALSGTDDRSPEPLPQPNMVLRKRIRKIKQGMKRYNSQLTLMRRDLRNCKAKIAEQQKQILEYASRLDENDKKNEETSRKFSTLLQVDTIGLGPQSVYLELNKCKTELQYWRSKSPATHPVCISCGKVMAPGPPEELQALANQGVLPFELDLEAPMAGTSGNEPDCCIQQWAEGDVLAVGCRVAKRKGGEDGGPPQPTAEAETSAGGKVAKRKGGEDVGGHQQQDIEPKKPRNMRSKRSKVWPPAGTPRSKI